MNYKSILKYGAVAGVSFIAGHTVGRAITRVNTSESESGHRSMEYELDRAYELLESMDERVDALEQYNMEHEIEHLATVTNKLERAVKHAEMEGKDEVQVPLTGEEFAAWMISILSEKGANNGTRRGRDGNGA